MKRRDLLQHMRQHGCQFVREGVDESPMAPEWKKWTPMGTRKAQESLISRRGRTSYGIAGYHRGFAHLPQLWGVSAPFPLHLFVRMSSFG